MPRRSMLDNPKGLHVVALAMESLPGVSLIAPIFNAGPVLIIRPPGDHRNTKKSAPKMGTATSVVIKSH